MFPFWDLPCFSSEGWTDCVLGSWSMEEKAAQSPDSDSSCTGAPNYPNWSKRPLGQLGLRLPSQSESFPIHDPLAER